VAFLLLSEVFLMLSKIVTPLILWLSCSSLVSASGTVFGQWSLSCGNQGRCLLSQLVAKDPEGKNVVLGASITHLGKNNVPVLILRVPGSAYEAGGVGIKVDDNQAVQIRYSTCDKSKCESVIKMDQTLLSEFEGGKQAVIAYALTKQHQMTLPLSLSGFDEAYKALQKTL
jgi:invasion protein IalB